MPSKSRSSVPPAESQQNFQQQITPRLLTIKQAAVYASATVSAIRQLLWSHTLPHVTIGKRFLIDRGDLDRFIDAQLSKSVQKAKTIAARLAQASAQ
jgi:excisionase family DNA binding protein